MMSYKKWLIVSISTITIILVMMVSVNLYLDTYGIRLMLFTYGNKKLIDYKYYPGGLNQHIFNPEFIFQNPDRFNSFLFGSSRVGTIDVSKITSGHFFNMSYSQGLPGEHLAVIKEILKRGGQIKSVIIGLDEFCFSTPMSMHNKQLLWIAHPDISGMHLPEMFFLYFLRKPGGFELTILKDRITGHKNEFGLTFDLNGRNLSWKGQEKIINETSKPSFSFKPKAYSPLIYKINADDEAFGAIAELIALSHSNNFSVIFFINPFYYQYYLPYAEGLMAVKQKLALVTDFYDFSGFNSVTINEMNYYEESHYRYLVGDMIVKRIFGDGDINVPKDFGVLVTRENVKEHIKKQKRELEDYLTNKK